MTRTDTPHAPAPLALALIAALLAVAGCERLEPPTESEVRPRELTRRQTQVYGTKLAELPDDGLRRQGGESFEFDALAGKPVLVSAIYTSCPMEKMCPLLTSKLARVQSRLLDEQGVGVEAFEIVLLTFDPKNDTPEAVRNYAVERGLDPANAHFVSGDPSTIAKVMEGLEIATKREDDQITHNMRTYVTDSGGRIYSGFRQSRWKPSDVAARLKAAIDLAS